MPDLRRLIAEPRYPSVVLGPEWGRGRRAPPAALGQLAGQLPGGLLAWAGKTRRGQLHQWGLPAATVGMTVGPGIWVIRLCPPDPGCTSLVLRGVEHLRR